MRGRRAVVWGASGGVGAALVDLLVGSGDYDAVHAGSRRAIGHRSPIIDAFTFDLLDEASIATAAADMARSGSVDVTIVATGLLHDARHLPEKNFAALTDEAMVALFRANTVGPALIAKHMIQAFPKDRRSVFAALSARVGSIGDNRLGGWHSYRASKAALNMIIANLAIELRRTRPQAIVLGLHPGTVDTGLSAPFQKRVAPEKLFSPQASAQHLLKVIEGATEAMSGSLLAWDGMRIVP